MEFCPVCWRVVEQTSASNIPGHLDKAKNACPASGQPFYITTSLWEFAQPQHPLKTPKKPSNDGIFARKCP